MGNGMKYKVIPLFRPVRLEYKNWFAVVKSKNVITLSVDNIFSEPKVGSPAAVSADTGSALFLGGHRLLKKVRGIASRTPFVGCIRNVSLNSELVDFNRATFEGNITVGMCRTN